jgi:hypothetical protein
VDNWVDGRRQGWLWGRTGSWHIDLHLFVFCVVSTSTPCSIVLCFGEARGVLSCFHSTLLTPVTSSCHGNHGQVNELCSRRVIQRKVLDSLHGMALFRDRHITLVGWGAEF